MLRTTTGKAVSWDSHPSEDRSEPPLQRRNGSIIVPNFSIIASSRTTRLFSLSVDRSLRSRYKISAGGHGGRRQVASREEERSAALTIQLSRNREGGCYLPLHFTTDIFLLIGGAAQKIFLSFFLMDAIASTTVLWLIPFCLAYSRTPTPPSMTTSNISS